MPLTMRMWLEWRYMKPRKHANGRRRKIDSSGYVISERNVMWRMHKVCVISSNLCTVTKVTLITHVHRQHTRNA